MKRLVFGALLALVVAGASRLSVVSVHASTVHGSAVTISGLDDLAATADQQARRGAGKIVAMVLGMGGLATVLSGRIGLGLAGVGAGNYWRNCCEYLLLGVRGTLGFQDHSVRNLYHGKRGKHSRKPDQVRVLIEKVSPAPRLELFGRDVVPGWTVWGNQIEATLFHPS